MGETGVDSARVVEQTAEEAVGKGPRPSDIRLRAFMVGLAIIPFDNYWVIITEKVYRGPYPTIISLFANCIFILASCTRAQLGIAQGSTASLAFTSAELLLIYTMLAIGASLAGHDMIPSLCMFLGHPWQVRDAWTTTG